MKTTTLWLLTVICGVALCACTESKFHIEGTLTDGADQTLYLENVSLAGVEVLDSVRLTAAGHFAFARPRPEAPDFFRLRVDRKIINIAIDSTETVTITASVPTMAADYEVEGSEDNEKIKELALLQMSLQAQVNAIIASPTLRLAAVEDSINAVVAEYKDYVRTNYIYQAPNRSYAYFALFQTLVVGNGAALIFNPRADAEDVKTFAAVGTSWDTYYPQSVRGENLHNIALEGMKNQRILAARASQVLPADKIDLSGIVEIALPDNHDTVRTLSSLRGKVVLLDFCLFAADGTNQRIMALREVYNKYHSRGLEIYQVSVDSSEHFWKTQTAALPWVSVRDADGANSIYLTYYNVMSLPTYFLLDRDCTPVMRDIQIDDIEKEIEALL